MAKKKPYSYSYTARQNPRRYLLSGIPPTLWARVQAQARRDHVAVRQVILALLDEWTKVDEEPPAEPPVEPEGGPDKPA